MWSVRQAVATYAEPDGLHHPPDMSGGPRVLGALNRVCDYGVVQQVGMCLCPVRWHPPATAKREVGKVWWGGHADKRMS